MRSRWSATALAVVVLAAAGCAADMGGATDTAVEEIVCGRTTCRIPNATATCSRGRCVIGSCFTFRGDCNHADADGCEVNLATDVNNCGGCGTTCATRPHTVATCASGACQYACESGYADCDGNTANGCEVNTGADDNNCGACGNRCWGGNQCCAGVCANTAYDLNNCGACGNVCGSVANGSPYCDGVACRSWCAWPFNDCDGSYENGCEANVTSDNNHCGACGNVCPEGGSCSYGTCVCSAGYACPDPATGSMRCIDVSSDVNNCGSCGITCEAGSRCVLGNCSCAAGSAQCYDSVTSVTRCTDIASDVNNCGGCGNLCAPGANCVEGRCVVGCTSCEGRCVETSVDPMHCGGCGRACAAGEFCSGGACVPLGLATTYVRTVMPTNVAYVDACQGVPGVLTATRASSATLTMPFDFAFWGTTFAAGAPINVATDGFINLDGWAAVRSGDLPSSARPNGVIAAAGPTPYAANYSWNSTGSLGICTATLGVAPSRRFVIEWYQMGFPFMGFTSAEIILNESFGAIDILTDAHVGPGGSDLAVIGLESPDGTSAVSACADAASVCATYSGLRVRFVPTR